jgi:PAS domain-containing protein
VIEGGLPSPQGSAWFCGHCGRTPRASLRAPHARVCESCFVGVLLEAETAALPGAAPFMVVDSTLRILAVSEAAEGLLRVYEQDATGRLVTEFLLQSDADADAEHFAVAISAAAADVVPIRYANIRLRQQRGVSARLRIATCVSPRAALVVFAECSDGGRPLESAHRQSHR